SRNISPLVSGFFHKNKETFWVLSFEPRAMLWAGMSRTFAAKKGDMFFQNDSEFQHLWRE
ncbi:MAG: hypothetical protein ACLFUS_13565, partial [Candidatus Sumerlaeia bacterium]